MSTEQKETQLRKMLQDLSNDQPVTILSLRAALVLALWDGQEIPLEIQSMILDITNEDGRLS